jgi:hypothetical protein
MTRIVFIDVATSGLIACGYAGRYSGPYNYSVTPKASKMQMGLRRAKAPRIIFLVFSGVNTIAGCNTFDVGLWQLHGEALKEVVSGGKGYFFPE